MTTKSQQKQFSRRFSVSDWQTLCGKVEFLDALDESLEMAEAVAHRILNPETASKD